MRRSFLVSLMFLMAVNVSMKLSASCCSSLSPGGVGRLLAHERAFVEIGNLSRLVYGSFDSTARFKSGHHAHLPHLIFEPELTVMARLFDFFEPFVKIPMRIQVSEQRVGSNPADLFLGARIPIMKEHALKNMPSITFSHQTQFPTGALFEKGMDNEKVTSTGAWLFSFGLLLEKYFKKITWGLQYSLGLEIASKKVASLRFIHAPSFTMGFPVHDGGIMAFLISPIFHTSTQGGPSAQKMPDSDRRKLTIASSYVYSLHSHIKINGQIGTDVPIDNLGKNFNNEFFLRLGMRFGIF